MADSHPIQCMVLSSRNIWEDVALTQEISHEDFLQVICYDYEAAARFVLDWSRESSAQAANFLAALLTRIYAELLVHDHYLRPRRVGHATTFGERRPSVARIAFERFCELLWENPPFVRQILNDENASMDVRQFSPLADRLGGTAAYDRGNSWPKYEFHDPEPVPREQVEQHLEGLYTPQIDRLNNRVQELEKASKEIRWAERRFFAQERIRLRQCSSKERKTMRELFLKLSLRERLIFLSEDYDIPLKVFPIWPEEITDDFLDDLSEPQLQRLLQRFQERWEGPWKELAGRVSLRLG